MADQLPAHEVYEIVIEEPEGHKRFLRGIFVVVTWFQSLFDGPVNPGGGIISVRERATGTEVFRHIEDLADDEAHVLEAIRSDLDTLTAAEFADRWA